MVTIPNVNPVVVNVVVDLVYKALGAAAAVGLAMLSDAMISQRIQSGRSVDMDIAIPTWSWTFIKSLYKSMGRRLGSMIFVTMMLQEIAHPLGDIGLRFETAPTGDNVRVLSLDWNAPPLYWWTMAELAEHDAKQRIFASGFQSDSSFAVLNEYRTTFLTGGGFTKNCLVRQNETGKLSPVTNNNRILMDDGSDDDGNVLCKALTQSHVYEYGPPVNITTETLSSETSPSIPPRYTVSCTFPFSYAEFTARSVPTVSTGVSTRIRNYGYYPAVKDLQGQGALEGPALRVKIGLPDQASEESFFYLDDHTLQQKMFV